MCFYRSLYSCTKKVLFGLDHLTQTYTLRGWYTTRSPRPLFWRLSLGDFCFGEYILCRRILSAIRTLFYFGNKVSVGFPHKKSPKLGWYTWRCLCPRLGLRNNSLGDIVVYSPPLTLVSNEFVIDNVIGYL